MKYIRKLLNPLVPFLILLLILFKMTYDNFSKLEDYTEEEEKLFAANIKELENLQNMHISKNQYYDLDFPHLYGRGRFCIDDSVGYEVKEKISSLTEIHTTYSEFMQKEGEKYVVSNGAAFGSGYKIHGSIITLFDDYITKIKDVDSTLFLYFKDYTFNNSISSSEIQRLYISKNKQELIYIMKLFEVEMSKIYYDAIKEFTYQKIYFPETDYIRKNTKVIPLLNTDSSFLQIETPLFVALDTLNNKIRMSEKIDYRLSNDGYYINPKDYKKNMTMTFTLNLKNICDTTLIYWF